MRVVGEEEFIIRGRDDKFRHIDVTIQVGKGVDDGSHLVKGRNVEVLGEVELVVVIKSKCPATKSLIDMVDVLLEVEQVHHHWRNGKAAAAAHGPSGPGCPTAFAGPGDNEAFDFCVHGLVNVFLHGIHGAHDGLGHGESEEVFRFVGVVQEVLPCVGDETILMAALWWMLSSEMTRLVGDLKQSGGDTAGCEGNSGSDRAVAEVTDLLGWAFVVITTGDPEEWLVGGLNLVWDDDDKVMPPHITVDNILGQPRL
mmetsp:Transcript_49751/g.116949  ORF Transcript_49751/g.116949 Transcript_49751/m.116949 type:complete len:255 (+) Transcript_49751:593-1357(+)